MGTLYPYSTEKSDLDLATFPVKEFFKRIRESVTRNQILATAIADELLTTDAPLHPRSSIRFSRTGAVRIKLQDLFTSTSNLATFFTENMTQKVFPSSNGFASLRGSSYLATLDTSLPFRERLQLLLGDYQRGIELLSYQESKGTLSKILTIAILDYVKNAATTLFNVLVALEKQGKTPYFCADKNYFHIRHQASHWVDQVVSLYYAQLFSRKEDYRSVLTELRQNKIAKKTLNAILDGYLAREYSSRFLGRPESCHPSTLAAFAALVTTRHPDCDVVFCFPSGSTELGSLVKYMYLVIHNKVIPSIKLPISLHSVKDILSAGIDSSVVDGYKLILQKLTDDLETPRHILLIDDNSSTGKTVGIASTLISRIYPDAKISTYVAEADLIRTEIDFHDIRRTHIAQPRLYDLAVNILPVSRTILRKFDLMELTECKQLIKNYREQAKKADSEIARIKFTILADALEYPTQQQLDETPPKDVIPVFRKSFLSNFSIVDVVRQGVTYPSVEHGYQAAKFDLDVFSKLSEDQLKAINYELRVNRGHGIMVSKDSHPFRDYAFTSGNIKVIADMLRNYGFVREDWSNIKLEVMIDLLLQKYEKPFLRRLLKETGSKLLVEGNTWNDTYWGYDHDERRGQNLLGRAIMMIRDKS